jgi:hypothetical protein
LKLFRQQTGAFLDGKFWVDSWEAAPELPDSAIEQMHSHTRALYLNCLEDLASYIRYGGTGSIEAARARSSLEFLGQKLA